MFNISRLERHIEEQMQVAHVPGLALAVIKDQEIIYARGFGITSIEDGGVPSRRKPCFGSAPSPNP